MEIQEFAKHILFSASLQEKLLQPESFSDADPGEAILSPKFPERPKTLVMEPYQTKKKPLFPQAHELEQENARGRLLHFFANHELLAMELMALALLKFPEAPKSFRMGIAQTILEERTHFLLYVERMQHFGITLGEIPLNGFFWNCISTMQSPLDYVVHMSLTFEQANLDYALHYRDILKKLGDIETASILERVYQEEIGHVKLGTVWFNRWRDPEEKEWHSYQKLLRSPLTPNRAKGIGFTREGRLKAGLSLDFIDHLEVYHHSKGRPGSLFFFNPICELQIAHGSIGYTPETAIQVMIHDFSCLPLFLARTGDTVLCPEVPSVSYLLHLQKSGFLVPEFLACPEIEKLPSLLKSRKFTRFEPWGWSPDTLKMFSHVKNHLVAPDPFSAWSGSDPFSALPLCFSKAWSFQLRQEFVNLHPEWNSLLRSEQDQGVLCHTLKEVEQSFETLSKCSADGIVIKGIFGSSGQNRLRFRSQTRPTSKDIAWISRMLQTQKQLIVECWMNKICDIGVLIRVQSQAKRPFLDALSFFTTGHGQYRGHFLGRKFAQVEPEILQWINGYGGEQSPLSSIFEAVASFVEKKLAQQGYTGFAGIDTFIYRDQGQLKLCPLVEINPRYTMGHVALELDKHISPRSRGLWLHLNLKDLQVLGFSNFKVFADEKSKQYPIQYDHSTPPRITNGILFTNDPEKAKMCLSTLLIAPQLQFTSWKQYLQKK